MKTYGRFSSGLVAAAGALAVLMFCPFNANAYGAMTLDIERAGMEVRLIGAVLDAVDGLTELDVETVPTIAALNGQAAMRTGEQMREWQASYELNFGQMARGVALGVGVPSEAEPPPRV